MSKTKNKISSYDAKKYLEKLLTDTTCISKMDTQTVKVLDEIMYYYPNEYIAFIEKKNHGKR